jgi:hypothetical protein
MFGFAIALVLTIASPGLAALQDADSRVAAIAWRLQTSNAALCSETAPLAGFAIQTLAQYQPAVRVAVAAQTGLNRQPGVQSVVAGGVADRAGLKPGDVLTRINGWPTPQDLPPIASYEATARTQAMIDAALKRPPLMLEIQRRRVRKTLSITGVTGCASRVEIVTDTTINAQADGRYVQISGALVDFTANDDELATAIAHELAHNILHHPGNRDTEEASHGVFAALAKVGSKSGGGKLRQNEFEADRLAIWLVARAGYDVDAVVPFWTRLAQQSADGVLPDGTHPDWNDRIDRTAAAVAEVKRQRASGAALVPTRLSIPILRKGTAQQSSSQAQFPR